MNPIIKMLGRYKKEAILGPLFKLLEAVFELLVPLVVASLIDGGILRKDKAYTVQMFVFLILLAVIGLISSVTAQYFAAKAAVGVSTRLRSELFKKIQSFSFSEIDKTGASTLITRMTGDVNQVQNGINMFLRLFLRSPFIVFGAMIMAFTVDFQSALVFVGVIPVLFAVVFAIILVSIPLYKKVQEKLDKVTLKTRENLTGVRVIRAFCREDKEINDFRQMNQELADSQNYVGKIIVLIYVGAIRVEQGIITQGAVVALYNYMSQILVELIKLANLIITMTKSVACAGRVTAILKTESSLEFINADSECGKKESGNYIEFSDVGLVYKGAGEESLSNISFSVKKGETVGIIGGTGSGKTSLVHLIPHFYDCTSGGVYIDGINVKAYPVEELRKKIGIVMQKSVLFKGTIRENILWGNGNASEKEISEAIEAAQVADVVNSKKDGLDEMIEQNGRNLSGGQRQRLTIARALVRKPEILILDDSSSALDYATDARLRQSIKKSDPNMTVFIVSQRTSSIMYADKIIVLDDGEIVGTGTHEQLLESCEVYREIHLSQNEK